MCKVRFHSNLVFPYILKLYVPKAFWTMLFTVTFSLIMKIIALYFQLILAKLAHKKLISNGQTTPTNVYYAEITHRLIEIMLISTCHNGCHDNQRKLETAHLTLTNSIDAIKSVQ